MSTPWDESHWDDQSFLSRPSKNQSARKHRSPLKTHHTSGGGGLSTPHSAATGTAKEDKFREKQKEKDRLRSTKKVQAKSTRRQRVAKSRWQEQDSGEEEEEQRAARGQRERESDESTDDDDVSFSLSLSLSQSQSLLFSPAKPVAAAAASAAVAPFTPQRRAAPHSALSSSSLSLSSSSLSAKLSGAAGPAASVDALKSKALASLSANKSSLSLSHASAVSYRSLFSLSAQQQQQQQAQSESDKEKAREMYSPDAAFKRLVAIESPVKPQSDAVPLTLWPPLSFSSPQKPAAVSTQPALTTPTVNTSSSSAFAVSLSLPAQSHARTDTQPAYATYARTDRQTDAQRTDALRVETTRLSRSLFDFFVAPHQSTRTQRAHTTTRHWDDADSESDDESERDREGEGERESDDDDDDAFLLEDCESALCDAALSLSPHALSCFLFTNDGASHTLGSNYDGKEPLSVTPSDSLNNMANLPLGDIPQSVNNKRRAAARLDYDSLDFVSFATTLCAESDSLLDRSFVRAHSLFLSRCEEREGEGDSAATQRALTTPSQEEDEREKEKERAFAHTHDVAQRYPEALLDCLVKPRFYHNIARSLCFDDERLPSRRATLAKILFELCPHVLFVTPEETTTEEVQDSTAEEVLIPISVRLSLCRALHSACVERLWRCACATQSARERELDTNFVARRAGLGETALCARAVRDAALAAARTQAALDAAHRRSSERAPFALCDSDVWLRDVVRHCVRREVKSCVGRVRGCDEHWAPHNASTQCLRALCGATQSLCGMYGAHRLGSVSELSERESVCLSLADTVEALLAWDSLLGVEHALLCDSLHDKTEEELNIMRIERFDALRDMLAFVSRFWRESVCAPHTTLSHNAVSEGMAFAQQILCVRLCERLATHVALRRHAESARCEVVPRPLTMSPPHNALSQPPPQCSVDQLTQMLRTQRAHTRAVAHTYSAPLRRCVYKLCATLRWSEHVKLLHNVLALCESAAFVTTCVCACESAPDALREWRESARALRERHWNASLAARAAHVEELLAQCCADEM